MAHGARVKILINTGCVSSKPSLRETEIGKTGPKSDRPEEEEDSLQGRQEGTASPRAVQQARDTCRPSRTTSVTVFLHKLSETTKETMISFNLFVQQEHQFPAAL